MRTVAILVVQLCLLTAVALADDSKDSSAPLGEPLTAEQYVAGGSKVKQSQDRYHKPTCIISFGARVALLSVFSLLL